MVTLKLGRLVGSAPRGGFAGGASASAVSSPALLWGGRRFFFSRPLWVGCRFFLPGPLWGGRRFSLPSPIWGWDRSLGEHADVLGGALLCSRARGGS